MDRGNAVEEQTDKQIANVPPCVGYGGCKDDSYEGTDKKNDGSVEYQVCQPVPRSECDSET